MTSDDYWAIRLQRIDDEAAQIAIERKLIGTCSLCKLNNCKWIGSSVWLSGQPTPEIDLRERRNLPYVMLSCVYCGHTLTFSCHKLFDPDYLHKLLYEDLEG